MTKSLDHTYTVGELVFDLPSQQLATITKITLVRQPDPFVEAECIDHRSAKAVSADDVDAGVYHGDDFFVVTVSAPHMEDWPNGERIFGEFCLPEDAETRRHSTWI